MNAFELICLLSVGCGMVCALGLAAHLVHRPATMAVMNVVWPVCALFGSWAIIVLYLRFGNRHDGQPKWAHVAKGSLHCGSGCTLGDIVAELTVLALPAAATAFGWPWLFGDRMFATWVLDTFLAFGFGIAFQYFAIVPMRHLTPREGLLAAVRADTASLLAWQVGMFGAMAVFQFWLYPHFLGWRPTAAHIQFWFAMQWAMITGFATSYPVNAWLIRQGLKEAM
ncbi:DUF4396 domain-containing protein [Luteibacter sp. CQ10]|uniref:DUF4396 domain-containing protein n=1 Tax=Luteibacter sp. CQ10 TaxID=2805821 RepID=UPI0034A12219